MKALGEERGWDWNRTLARLQKLGENFTQLKVSSWPKQYLGLREIKKSTLNGTCISTFNSVSVLSFKINI